MSTEDRTPVELAREVIDADPKLLACIENELEGLSVPSAINYVHEVATTLDTLRWRLRAQEDGRL